MTRTLHVRMYRMGFGDCFLLSLRGGDGRDRHILIDCGSITDGKDQVSRVAQDVIKTCTPRQGPPTIDLVVCTHRHRDHVGGFKDPAWRNVQVGAVWMPWTEDPDDLDATRIRNGQSSFALALARAVGPAAFDADASPLEDAADGVDDVNALAMALNALTNEAAMTTLHRGFAGAPPRTFLPLKDTVCEARTLPGVPGLKIHVLGPPRSEVAMASMQPPHDEVFLTRMARRAAAKAAPAPDAPPVPEPQGAFRASWRLPKDAVNHAKMGWTFESADERAVNLLAEEPDGDLAAAIDRAVNNTSLILMFEIGDQWLLFPGDAQWGGWEAALDEPRCARLLARTTFYKVGHHGSENATPRSLVEQVIRGPYTAFLPTRSMTQWPNIPRGPLVDAMTARSAVVVRSDDEAAATNAAFKVEPGLYIEWEVEVG